MRGYDFPDGDPVYYNDPGVFSQTDVTVGTGDDDQGLESLLAGTGYAPGLPIFTIPTGAPPLAAPEPSTWAMIVAGFACLGFGRAWRGALSASAG